MASAGSKIVTQIVRRSDLLHLDFGLRAGTSQTKLIIFQAQRRIEFLVTDKRLYQRFFSDNGLNFFGYEEIQQGALEHPIWEFFYDGKNDEKTNLDFITSGLGNALKAGGKLDQIGITRNVVFSIRAMLYRLRDVSNAYSEQLTYALAQDVGIGRRFANLATMNVFLNIHSFLVETGTLRDHLATFLSANVFPSAKASRMADLRKHLERIRCSEPFAQLILKLTDRSDVAGWMARLGAFRNSVVHDAPISAFSDGLAGLTRIPLSVNGNSLSGVSFELPQDPILSPNGDKIDALRLCVKLARNMIGFFQQVVAASKLSPKITHITDADLQ
jgi:hypothetical protein